LSLLTPIDSGHANLGDDVTLKLVRPLNADGATVLPADWLLHGRVTKVKRAGKNCKQGQIVWKLDPLKTPGGNRLKVQRVRSYPFKYRVTSGDPVWVPLATPWTTIGAAARFTVPLGVGVALSPLWLPFGILMALGNDCEGQAGKEEWLPPGFGDLFAISKGVRVKPLH
jgi:hypothetical protein